MGRWQDAGAVSGALAIFVKTPGHSPVKTRLAVSIGPEAAEAFHSLAARAVAEAAAVLADGEDGWQVYWAVAERAAMDAPGWHGQPRLWQGEGGLGERLDRVYASLHAVHGQVLLVGADSPQLTPDLLRQARHCLDEAGSPFVMGEANDGGFWLFGGRTRIAREVWCGVRYSQQDTAAQLRVALHSHGTLAELKRLSDVDRGEDLEALVEALEALPSPLPAQRALLHWLKRQRLTIAPA